MSKYKLINSNFNDEKPYGFGEYTQSYKQFIYWGDDNLLPNKLLDLFGKSGMHSAIVKRKTDMVSGKGILPTNQNTSFIENINGTEDLNSIVQKVSFDVNLFGIGYLNIIWNADNTYISQIEHVPAEKVRISKQKVGQESYYLISRDWQYTSKPGNQPVPIAPYNQADKENKSQLLCIKEYVPGCEYYSLPDYVSGARWIELDVQIANYHLGNVKNGFSPSVVISYSEGIPTDEEQRILYNSLKNSFTGAKNAGEVLITFSESKDTTPVITPIQPNDSDGRYKELMEIVIQEICSTHRLTAPELAGISTPGKLSTSSETVEAELRFQETVISQKMKLIERQLTKLAQINNAGKIELIPAVNKRNLSTDTDTEISINK